MGFDQSVTGTDSCQHAFAIQSALNKDRPVHPRLAMHAFLHKGNSLHRLPGQETRDFCL